MPRELSPFTLTNAELGVGASFGNSALWVNTKGSGAIERVFCNALAQSLFGTILVRYGALGIGSHDRPHVGLTADGHRSSFDLHPAYQCQRFTVGGGIHIAETTFVPLRPLSDEQGDPPVVYLSVEIHNDRPRPVTMRVVAAAWLRGSTAPDVRAQFDRGLHALIATNESAPNAVRIFGMAEAPTRFDTTFDFAAVYDPNHLGTMTNKTDATGDILGRLQADFTLKENERKRLIFKAGVFAATVEDAARRYEAVPACDEALHGTIEHLTTVARTCEVLTPDPLINEGALWSKINMRRVMAQYPQGRAFTNDPGSYANVVIRDGAWFVYGCDHFLPEFSRQLLENFRSRQYANGKMPEYYDAVHGNIEDDGLNINDDTPLYILAVNHHFRSTGDHAWLEKTYPSVAAAANYIVTQVDERGLVFCSARDPRGNVWAIAGWRNIIPNYAINGAVTEINAECVAALRAAHHLAQNLGERDNDAEKFLTASARTREAMDRHLLNPTNGLYYLNVDADGNVHSDVTGDEIFPVMFRTCDEETAFRIVSRLNSPDFWTKAGLRTVSRNDPRYDPTAYSGLVGGVWPGLTWWYAFAAARYHPEFMVRALRSSFEHYGADPLRNNTVPGQFSEWFDGESLANRGMRLSPWEPPRFLWAATEGICGLMLTTDKPKIKPLVPHRWTWVALRNLPYHGSMISYFSIRQANDRMHICSTTPLDTDVDLSLYDRDVSDDVAVFAEHCNVVALACEDKVTVLLGSTDDGTINVPVNLAGVVKPEGRYEMRTYNSDRHDWQEPVVLDGSNLAGIAVSIEAGGFRLLELTPV